MLLLLAGMVLVPVFWGPDTRFVEQQAIDAEILLSDEAILALYEPIPSVEENAGPELCSIIDEFESWGEFFEQHWADYEFQYAQGVEFQKDINSKGIDEGVAAIFGISTDVFLKKYPKPKLGFDVSAKEDIANLKYYFNYHKKQFARLINVIENKDRFYLDSWIKWEMKTDSVFGTDNYTGVKQLKSAAMLLADYSAILRYEGRDQELLECVSFIYKLSDYIKQEHFSLGVVASGMFNSFADTILLYSLSGNYSDDELYRLFKLIPETDLISSTRDICHVKMYMYDFIANRGKYRFIEGWNFSVWSLDWNEDYFKSLLMLTKYVDNVSKIDYLERVMSFREALSEYSLKEYNDLCSDFKSNLPFFPKWRSHLTMPSLYGAVLRCIRTEAINRIAKIAIVLEQYRLVNGNYPQKLDDLFNICPDLQLVDIMSIDGKELQYEFLSGAKGKKSYVIYSDMFELVEQNYDSLDECRKQDVSYCNMCGRIVLQIVK